MTSTTTSTARAGSTATGRTASNKWDTRKYMVLRGAIGGLAAGVFFGLLQMWFLADASLPADTIIHMIATIVQPDELFATGETSLAVGWAVHVALSITYGALFGLLCVEFESNITRVWTACVYGAFIYMFNFLVLAPLFYPVFQTANQPFEGTVHVVYGALLIPFVVRWSGRRVTSGPALPPIAQRWEEREAQAAAQPAPRTFDPASLR
jgi:hypothetical protein